MAAFIGTAFTVKRHGVVYQENGPTLEYDKATYSMSLKDVILLASKLKDGESICVYEEDGKYVGSFKPGDARD